MNERHNQIAQTDTVHQQRPHEVMTASWRNCRNFLCESLTAPYPEHTLTVSIASNPRNVRGGTARGLVAVEWRFHPIRIQTADRTDLSLSPGYSNKRRSPLTGEFVLGEIHILKIGQSPECQWNWACKADGAGTGYRKSGIECRQLRRWVRLAA